MNETSGKIAAVFGIVLILSSIAIPIVGYFAVSLPAQVSYNRAFGGQISVTIDQPTLAGMSTGLLKLWKSMNSTFGTEDHAGIYGSGFYWSQTPDNSLASEDTYFRAEISRLNNYTAQYAAYTKAGTQIVIGLPLQDWYDKVTNSSRHELNRNGGLDWAIQGAWMLKFAPFAYWIWLYMAVICIPMFLIGVVLVVVGGNKAGWLD